jgi:23S rRNA (cytosine1962-C5)-methyltransferase
MLYAALKLKKNEDKRLRQGHLWIYSNEIDVKQTPLSHFKPGEWVSVIDAKGDCLGNGYINPNTLLCARLLTRNPNQSFDVSFFQEKIQKALSLRTTWFTKPFYRLIHGEGDGLPGLIVDRYGDYLVVQTTTFGMERLKNVVLEALQAQISPQGILWKNDSNARRVEGLPLYVEKAAGDVPEELFLEENGVKFQISVYQGQKTGWFYDHRDNRQQLQHLVRDKKVLDVFSYVGGWAIQAACYGAKEVWALDSSGNALTKLQANAVLNRVTEKIKTYEADAFSQLKAWVDNHTKFDVIILDPPAFIKKRKDHAEGLAAYKKINLLALQLLTEGGYLVSASCSHHLSAEELQDCLRWAGVKTNRTLQILKKGHPGADHPIHPAIVETEYLKCFICRVVFI